MKARSPKLELELNTESARKIRETAYQVGAFRDGPITLSSGIRSDRYFEGQKVTLWPQGAYDVGKAVFDELVKIGVDAVGGLATGAYPIVAAVAVVSHLEGKPVPTFVVREKSKQHGTRQKIEGHLKKGWRVAIVDDVVTTGGSILKAIQAVEEANCKVAKVIAIVDRCEGGSDRIREKGYDFSSILRYPAPKEVKVGG